MEDQSGLVNILAGVHQSPNPVLGVIGLRLEFGVSTRGIELREFLHTLLAEKQDAVG